MAESKDTGSGPVAPAQAAPAAEAPKENKSKTPLIIGIVVVIVILIGGCVAVAIVGKSLLGDRVEEAVTEDILEEVMEESIGGDADVDIDDDTFTWESEDGSGSVGEATEWPDDIPSDIPEFTYADIISHFSLGDETGSGWTLTFENADSDAINSYGGDLESDGWVIISTYSDNDVEMITAEKGNDTITCSCSNEDDTCSVIISVEVDAS